MFKKGLLFIQLLVITSCNHTPLLFENPKAKNTGIDFKNIITETDQLNILDYLYFYNGGGVAVGDINNDGLPDIYLSGNQVKNKLYLNKGNLTFEDISQQAGVEGKSTWNTGTVMADVNGDGFLDIYVCAVVGLLGFEGHNELFINNGDNTFTEQAAAYGLDATSYSSSAAFFDYDLDGDLDMYLLNHAIHTQESFGNKSLRYKRNYQTGDKLFRNDGNTFTEVSEAAGIYGGINSYGLGVSVADFNQDGYPDLYIGNDFHEDDYYYLNNQDGTFSEKLRDYFGHTSRFSMGNDAADINHDGLPDLISLDMLPSDEKTLKSSEGDDNIQTQKMRIEQYGYHFQFTRNMLYINQPSGTFQETALLSGIAATDWSWSALFADYNQDGEQDLFIANGIPKRPNNLDYIKFVSSEQMQQKIISTKLLDNTALQLMPKGNIPNAIFEGSKNLSFIDQSKKWIIPDSIISGASALADLDNDGDIDIITNNLNEYAGIYQNTTNEKATYLKIKFVYNTKNRFGIGTKVFAYHNGILQYKELYPSRGFQASSEPIIHFGFRKNTQIDSIRIVWPDRTSQLLTKIATNQTLTLTPENTSPFYYSKLFPKTQKRFQLTQKFQLNFTHTEDSYIDFNRQKLIPYQVSDRGPAVAVGDLNGDGKEDVFFGSSKFFPAQIFIQKDSIFEAINPSLLKENKKNEEVSAAILDLDNNGNKELILGTGGADFYNNASPLLNLIYSKKDTLYTATTLPESFANTSIIAPFDYDYDGDMDVFIGNQSITNHFGKTPLSYWLKNEQGKLVLDTINPAKEIGMVTQAIWSDFNKDAIADLIVVGEWMQPTFFANINGVLTPVKVTQETLNGLWQAITPFDIDDDGDIDYILGNWGTNSKFNASTAHPMRLYYSDFDSNGQSETIVTTYKEGKDFPLAGLDELSSQLVSLKKKYTSYAAFAGQSIDKILDKKQLGKAQILEVNILQSGYLKNNEGAFKFVPFDARLQVAPMNAFCLFDFNGDGNEEVLAAGNYFGVKPYHGRLDSFSGALIYNENEITLSSSLGLNLTQKAVRHLNIIHINKNPHVLVTFNNDSAQVYEILKN